MARVRKKTVQEKRDEQELRSLVRIFAARGVTVRQENLSRGSSFRVKSGNCVFAGKDVIFLDRRLPLSQQISLLTDVLLEAQLELNEDELATLPPSAQALWNAKRAA